MSEKEKIKQKIAKLFSLADSGNSNEASVALRRATDLMQKWGFEMSDIDLADENIVYERIETGRKHKHDLHRLLVPLAEYCSVKVWVQLSSRYIRSSQYTICVVGYETDIVLFKHFWHYLDTVYKTEMETFKQSDEYVNRTVHGKRIRNAFKVGFIRSIADKLYEAAEERETVKTTTGTELVPMKMANIDEWYEEEIGEKLVKVRTHTRVTTDAGYDAGSTSGSNTSFNAPINGNGESVKLIGG